MLRLLHFKKYQELCEWIKVLFCFCMYQHKKVYIVIFYTYLNDCVSGLYARTWADVSVRDPDITFTYKLMAMCIFVYTVKKLF